MTIYWQVSEEKLKVWVHGSDPSSDPPDQTEPREFGTPKDFPPEVFDLAKKEAKESLENFQLRRYRLIVLDATFEQIERYEE